MTDWATVATLATAANVVLLGVLVAVWGRNYLELRSKHTLGLLVFALLLLAENAFAVYYYLVDPDLSVWFNSAVPDVAWRALMLFHVLELAAIAFLTWVTLD